MDQTQTPSEHPKLDALIAGYLEAVERGEAPDRNQIIAENPELATELRAFFDDLDHVQRAAASPNDGPAPNKPDAAHASTVIRSNNEPTPGVIIAGRYKLLENIGEGGMGSVWVAEQLKPVKRKVAIKLIKPGMDSKQVLARFEAERQALAVMDHPNIAKVFDGGLTEQGRPYFVMEYVKGVPFTDYCDRARLPLKDRLTLFIAVCSAVQHAHQKGIVHRDLKPSNILICLYDGHPVPKVIDFGLAKAMHQPLTEQSIFTGHGVMVGTPLYMSPEQAESNNLDIDTRTDIYSLGVVLYELLTGSTPLERQQLQKAAFDEVLRLIKEVEPPRPSLRLSGSESLASIAAQRSIDPKQLSRSLAGDLDWIVMKTLDKERSRRYETANGLARDIERFLNEEPVEACPPSTVYRLKKFVKRYKPQVTAATIVLLALVAGITGTSWGLRKARIAEEKAVASEYKTIQALADVTQERDAKEAERKKAEVAKQAESEQRVRSERQLLAGIIRPIGYSGDPDAEIKALADWSALENSHLQLLGLEVAFEDPAVSMRIARRCERVIQACVGLSPKRRAKAIELTTKKQSDMTVDPRTRVAACWLAMELGSVDLPAFDEAITHLSDMSYDGKEALAEFVDFASKRRNPQQEDVIVQCLINALATSNDENVAWHVGGGLTDLAPRMSTKHLKPFGDTLLGLFVRFSDELTWRTACECLGALAHRLDADQLARAGDILIGNLQNQTSHHILRDSEVCLVKLSSRLSNEQFFRFVDALIAIINNSTSGDVLMDTSKCLAPLAARLNARQVEQAWDTLIGAFNTSTFSVSGGIGLGLTALAPRLSDEQQVRGVDALIGVIERSLEYSRTEAASDCLKEMTPRLTDEQITRLWDVSTNVLEKTRDYRLKQAAGKCLAVLASKMSDEQASRVWDMLNDVLENSTSEHMREEVTNNLVDLASTLSIGLVNRRGDALIDVLENSGHKEDDRTRAAVKCLTKLAPKLSDEQVNRVWNALTSILEEASNQYLAREIQVCLVALAPRLGDEQVTHGADVLIGILEEWNGKYITRAATDGLFFLTPRLSLDQLSRWREALLSILENSKDVDDVVAVSIGLPALSAQMTPEQRSHVVELLIRNTSPEFYWNDESPYPPAIELLGDSVHREPFLKALIEQMLDYAGSLDFKDTFVDQLEPSTHDSSSLRACLSASSNPRMIMELASHPGCFGKQRKFLLQRFEEIVFHNGKHVFLNPKKDKDEDDSEMSKTSGNDAARLAEGGDVTAPERRFHNLHDAAAWIEQNWPDFDLETNHPMTWRAGN